MSEFAELHEELRAVARDVLKAPAPGWDLFAGAGWTGLEVPEDLEGAGVSFAEVAVILREMGRAAARTEYLGAGVLGVGTLLALEPGPERDDLLQKTATGEAVPVAVVGPGPGPFGMNETRLSGRVEFIPDAAAASRLLILARDTRGEPVIVDIPTGTAGLRVEAQPVVDETRRLAVVTADGAEGSVLRFAGDPEAAAGRLLDRAAVAIACDSLGLMEAMLERTVAYAKARQQFGRPIGSFRRCSTPAPTCSSR